MPDRRTIILEAATRMIAQAGVRGLRVEQVAERAGVSTALIYYHFTDRAGLMRATLAFINERAERYTQPDPSPDARTALEQMLLLELQDTTAVRENSTAWGELRSTAIFETYLRDQLRQSTRQWVADISELAAHALAEEAAAGGDPAAIAERLTALVEGLSERWLSGSIELERARQMLRQAIAIELAAAHAASTVT